MTTYYKAVHPDGGSFFNASFRWLPKGWKSGDPIPEGWTVGHPNYQQARGAANYLSVSVTPTDCTGMRWPCVLLEVEPLGEVTTPEPEDLPSKRAGAAFRVVRELPATDALGPQGVHVAALIERSRQLTADDAQKMIAAKHAARYASMEAAWKADAARDTAMEAAWKAGTARDAAMEATVTDAVFAARDAARIAARAASWEAVMGTGWAAAWDATVTAAADATRALIVRDLLAREHYDTLTRPWRTIIGPIHPHDNDFVKD